MRGVANAIPLVTSSKTTWQAIGSSSNSALAGVGSGGDHDRESKKSRKGNSSSRSDLGRLAIPRDWLPSLVEQCANRPIPAKYADKPYFGEFGRRSAFNYGHTFCAWPGRPENHQEGVVGLHPARKPLPWMIATSCRCCRRRPGGASDGDDEDVYHRPLSRLFERGRKKKKTSPSLAEEDRRAAAERRWGMPACINCNAFVGSVARYMGLQSPESGGRNCSCRRIPTAQVDQRRAREERSLAGRGTVAALERSPAKRRHRRRRRKRRPTADGCGSHQSVSASRTRPADASKPGRVQAGRVQAGRIKTAIRQEAPRQTRFGFVVATAAPVTASW